MIGGDSGGLYTATGQSLEHVLGPQTGGALVQSSLHELVSIFSAILSRLRRGGLAFCNVNQLVVPHGKRPCYATEPRRTHSSHCSAKKITGITLPGLGKSPGLYHDAWFNLVHAHVCSVVLI